ncbi:Immunoglobulin domain protein [Trichostrongylus colubriformis]|uniref:Immunoglobulin domain protein n=1 Tax=Trichostrongylus colubriformis TaxID=6319 RepID=A0AAN8FK27_TRICO
MSLHGTHLPRRILNLKKIILTIISAQRGNTPWCRWNRRGDRPMADGYRIVFPMIRVWRHLAESTAVMYLIPLVFVLTFRLIPSSAESRLSILPPTNPLQKPSGQQVPLLCTVEGTSDDTRPGIIWSKHGGIDRTGNVEVKSLDHHTMSLLIKNATSEDSGVYTCQAQLGSHLLSQTVDVIIFENFTFASEKTAVGPVTPGGAANLTCEVSPPSVRVHTVWTREGVAIDQGNVDKYKLYNNDAILEISKYDPAKDAGEYVCKVFHPISGSTLYRRITVGTETENKQLFCSRMCNTVCHQMYTPFSKP